MAPRSARAGSASPWAWVALAVALSPSLAELSRHLAGEPPDRYVLVAAVLLVLALARGGTRAAARPALGLAALGAAVALELLGIASGSWSFARLAIPVALLGMAHLGASLAGRLAPRVALLGFGLIPVPNFIVNLGTPEVESALARALAGAFGPAIESAGPLLHAAGGRLELTPHDDGLRLAIVLALLGWYAGLVRGAPWPAALIRSVAFAGASLLLQPLALLVAAGLLLAGAPGAAAGWLTTGSWLVVAAGGLLLSHRSPQRAPPDSPGATGRS